MRVRVLACALALAFPLAARAQQQPPAPPVPAGDAAKGKATYVTDGCVECHGGVGQGSRGTGPRLARTQLPLDAFLQQLRQPSFEMPPYEAAVIPDQDAANIYAFLQSLPPPLAGKDIPLLNQ
ncbi:MAG TPA: cytochrome c [Stellaceae bacterium]|nr:cytochrome c [Stellaceae bacterium]